ncbi:pyridoxal 5'-phosphate synthase glutaminase subunit PdxT [Schaalia sp. ZJ405]|uniref:pyridoxal 5'-phosphate synthase glutaminase subunit PdxT n=1 Tax=Schaalia sp. ZJ405 TaxID=2709403 RepID=UPI0013EBE3A9|nr:pyridoxal 5'-phosphate synthase glutaminase subunit PdxT [Schaalia sp. ZJ405]QPK80524.1 pyridoxal 5'-phosphate synthase glutaminase subunit PdxT [Schaalia sp. ZJ405]
MVTIGILALQGDVAEHVRALEVSGARAVPVRRRSELEAVDGLVIPGGESTTMSKLLLAFDLFEPVRSRIDAGMPVWGTCAGMIMLASSVLDGRDDQRSFGAIDMVVRRNAFGRQVDSYEEDLEITGIKDPYHAVFIRAPWVESTGQSVEVLARVGNAADGPIVAVRSGQAMACSFHPEIGSDTRMHELFVEMVRASQTPDHNALPRSESSSDAMGD